MSTCSFTARRVLIAGLGYVGRALAARLVAADATVFGLSRNPEGVPEGVRPLQGDLLQPATLRLPAALDSVVFLAAPDRSEAAAYREIYVDGSRHLLAALERVGMPQRLVFASSTSVYGQTDGSWVDEDSPTEPAEPGGRLLLEAEGVWRGLAERAVVVRLGGIYGPGRTRLIEQVRRGEAHLPATPVYTNRIHREDCAGVIAHILALQEPDGVYVGVDRDPADLADVLRFIAARLGVNEPPVGDAATAVRTRGGSKRARSDRLLESGYSFAYPSFREGYAELIAGTDFST